MSAALKPEERTKTKLIASFYLSPKYSDLIITCGSQSFPAHKLVVCSGSDYFSDACSDDSQGSPAKIDLSDAEPIIIEKVLQFLYTGDYSLPVPASQSPATPDTQGNSSTSGLATPDSSDNEHDKAKAITQRRQAYPSLIDCHDSYFHLRMYGEAADLKIESLMTMAARRFRASFRFYPPDTTLEDVVKELYSSEDVYQALKPNAIDTIVRNIPVAWNGTKSPLNRELMKLVPGFTIDLCIQALNVAKQPKSEPQKKPSKPSDVTLSRC